MARPDQLRLLIVSPSFPHPTMWGFGMRVYELIRLLSQRHQVSLLTYARPDDGDRPAWIARWCTSVHSVPWRGPRHGRRRAQAASLLSKDSFQWSDHRSEEMQTAIDDLLRREQFDLIQIESSQMAGFDFGSVPMLVDEHNIEYELLLRMFREERTLPRRLYSGLEYLKVRREERRCWHRAAGVIVTSEREAAILRRRAPGTPSAVVANGVDVDYFSPSSAPVSPNTIVFTGLMRYRPNSDAALYFVREMLPRILRVRPDVTFTAVGAGAPEELRRLGGPNVTVTDWVPDVRPYVAESAVFVVPLRVGSGTRLKVLEGLAMARPIVSTSLGCEGIDVRGGQHLLIADQPDDFARAVLRLLDDRALATRLGTRGRTLVESRYGWTSVMRPLDTLYQEVLRSPRRMATAGTAGPAANALDLAG